MAHSVQVSFDGDEERGRGNGVLRGNWGNGARPVSWISSWGNSRISVRYFYYFLFLFFCFFSVLWCVLSLLSIPVLPAPQFCRCFVFPIQLKADSRKNFIMKLNRCQFIRLETRQYLELSAISVSPPCLSLFLTTRVLSKICRHLLCIFYDLFPLYLPPFFCSIFQYACPPHLPLQIANSP